MYRRKSSNSERLSSAHAIQARRRAGTGRLIGRVLIRLELRELDSFIQIRLEIFDE
jgi:hypothetical protein